VVIKLGLEREKFEMVAVKVVGMKERDGGGR